MKRDPLTRTKVVGYGTIVGFNLDWWLVRIDGKTTDEYLRDHQFQNVVPTCGRRVRVLYYSTPSCGFHVCTPIGDTSGAEI